jgi:hypothetical protein
MVVVDISDHSFLKQAGGNQDLRETPAGRNEDCGTPSVSWRKLNGKLLVGEKIGAAIERAMI